MSESNQQWNLRMSCRSNHELVERARNLASDATEGPLTMKESPGVSFGTFDLLTEDHGAPALERVLPNDAPLHSEARELVLLLADRLESLDAEARLQGNWRVGG